MPREEASPAPRRLFVTGGAGYIGSHVVLRLLEQGHAVLVFDNLSTGRRLPGIGGDFHFGDLGDRAALRQALARGPFDAVLHFAASTDIGESQRRPLAYHRNNAANSLALLEACREAGIDRLIFSSTAAVYGDSAEGVLRESAPLCPTSPYGASKLAAERMIADLAAGSDLRFVALRYFNVAGADPASRAGPLGDRAEHLITALCRTILGRQEGFVINGDDYPTPDGTCERDFIHVLDRRPRPPAGRRGLADPQLRLRPRHLGRRGGGRGAAGLGGRLSGEGRSAPARRYGARHRRLRPDQGQTRLATAPR